MVGLHQILAGNVITKLSISIQSSGVVATLEIFFIGCNRLTSKKYRNKT